MKKKILLIVGGLLVARFVWAWLSASGQLDNPHAIAGWYDLKPGAKFSEALKVFLGAD